MNKFSLLAAVSSALVFGAASVHAADAAANWTKNCAACHGPDGAGKTKAGRMAGVKDMTDAQYQQSFTDDQAFTQIKGGLTDKNGKTKMKAFGDVLSDPEVKDLVAFVRGLKK